MQSVANGNLDAMTILFDRYHEWIYNFFFKMKPDVAFCEDLTQNVFYKALRYRSSYGGGKFASWIFTIARNLFHDQIEKEKHRSNVPVEHLAIVDENGSILTNSPIIKFIYCKMFINSSKFPRTKNTTNPKLITLAVLRLIYYLTYFERLIKCGQQKISTTPNKVMDRVGLEVNNRVIRKSFLSVNRPVQGFPQKQHKEKHTFFKFTILPNFSSLLGYIYFSSLDIFHLYGNTYIARRRLTAFT